MPEDRSLREVAEQAINRHGEVIAHTTVRSALTEGPKGVRIDTLAAICDAVDVDMISVITGRDFAYLETPKGFEPHEGATLRAIPVVSLSRASHWAEDVKHPDRVQGIVYLPMNGSEGYMAAVIDDPSMAPRLNKGDVIIFKKGEPRDGGLAVVQVKDAPAAVRTYFAQGNDVVLRAKNEDYGEQRVRAQSLTFKASVVTIIERLT